MDDPVVIVGSGHAGAQAAIALRQRRYEGPILLLGDEPDPPYERPPLTKDYLSGLRTSEQLALRTIGFWNAQRVTLRPGSRVMAVTPASYRLELDDGETVAYSKLIWATGGLPRRLACCGSELQGIHVIRKRADIDNLRADLRDARHVMVVGGGYIGLETAAVLVSQGYRITLVEAQDRLLARVAACELSDLLIQRHKQAGVDVRLGVTVAGLSGSAGRVAVAHLSDGTDLSIDSVIVGIGIIPAVQILKNVGAAGANGVDVDAECRTSLPGIMAVGDCAARENRFANGRRIRVESVQNAMEQPTLAASAVTQQAPPALAVPTFWSNQYEMKIQTAGLSLEHDGTEVMPTEDGHGTIIIYRKQGRIIAADCLNAPRAFMEMKRAIATNFKE